MSVALATALLCWPLAGCAMACTVIGGESGVVVVLDGGPSSPSGASGTAQTTVTPPSTVTAGTDIGTIHVCVAGTCTSGDAGPVTQTERQFFVSNPKVSSTDAVDVTVTVTRRDGTVMVPATVARVSPVMRQPNGPNCEPTVYVAQVAVTSGS